MKRVVRAGVFETNSSAMHSIAIKKDGNMWLDKEPEFAYYDLQIDANGVHRIPDDAERCYWGFFRYLETFTEKLYYAIAVYCKDYPTRLWRNYCDKRWKKPTPDRALRELAKIERAVHEIYPHCRKIKIPTKLETFYVDAKGKRYFACELDETGQWVDDYPRKKKVRPLETFRVWQFGEIYCGTDHVLPDFLKEKGITLKEFLENAQYVIVLDDDRGPQIENRIRDRSLRLFTLECQAANGDPDERNVYKYLFPICKWCDKPENQEKGET